jgi:hypothetical protein
MTTGTRSASGARPRSNSAHGDGTAGSNVSHVSPRRGKSVDPTGGTPAPPNGTSGLDVAMPPPKSSTVSVALGRDRHGRGWAEVCDLSPRRTVPRPRVRQIGRALELTAEQQNALAGPVERHGREDPAGRTDVLFLRPQQRHAMPAHVSLRTDRHLGSSTSSRSGSSRRGGHSEHRARRASSMTPVRRAHPLPSPRLARRSIPREMRPPHDVSG